jgi:hypothetical protein
MKLKRFAFTLVAAISAMGQTPTSSIVGDVLDPSGLPVPDATTNVRNKGTGESRRTRTDNQGRFTVLSLPPGGYDVEVQKDGFHTARQSEIVLEVGQAARLGFTLSVGSTSQVIEVAGTAPAVNTENATRGQVIANSELTQLPLSGRSFQDLALLVPGVTPTVEGFLGSGFSANGARADSSVLLVDGVPARNAEFGTVNPSANLESVREFKLLTNNYSAEYGQFSGGVMTVALNGGANQPHGSAFWFARNAVLEARNFFASSRADLSRHQFGSSFSGPVVLPRLYQGRNRTFFVVSWESLRQNVPSTEVYSVPTLLQRRGDFSQTPDATGKPVVLADPKGKGVLPGSIIPASAMSPAAVKALSFYPQPDNSAAANNYRFNNNAETSSDNVTFKVDQQFSNRNSLSLRAAYQPTGLTGSQPAGVVPGFSLSQTDKSVVSGLNYTRIFTPGLISELRVGYTRFQLHQINAFTGRNMLQEFGIPSGWVDPERVGFPTITIRGMSAIGDSACCPQKAGSNTTQFAGSLTWIRGAHAVKAGVDKVRTSYNSDRSGSYSGTFSFLGRWTNDGFADFLYGYPETTQRNTRGTSTYMRSESTGAYVQDDVKASRRLTLNLGLRYEILYPPYEKRGHWANFVPELRKIVIASDEGIPGLQADLALAGLAGKVLLARDAGLPDHLAYVNYGNFAPRIGLAFRPFHHNRTSIRAGWGMFYGANYLAPIRTLMAATFPFLVTQNFARVTTNPDGLSFSNAFPEANARSNASTNTAGYELRAPSSVVQNFNVSIEQQISSGMVLETAYSGSVGSHLGRGYDLNQPFLYDSSKRLANGTIARPYEGFGGISYFAFGSGSNYHSGVLAIRRQLSHGLMYRANYLFGKAIDDASSIWHPSTGGFNGAQDSRNLRLERGRSDSDARHSVAFSFSWTIVDGPALVRGWQLAGTGQARSGTPLTPRSANVNTLLGEAPRPDRVRSGATDNPGPEAWFDKTAFVPVPRGSFRPGNSGRNVLDGPGFLSFNFALMRNFKVAPGDRGNVQFRCEAFNALNRANFLTPIVNVDVPNAATATRARPGRSMQLALRYSF